MKKLLFTAFMLATVVLFSACNDDKKNDEPDPNPSTPVTAVKTVTDILELYGEEQKTVVDAMAAFGKGLSSSGDLLFVGNNIKMYDAACMIDYRFNTKSICIQSMISFTSKPSAELVDWVYREVVAKYGEPTYTNNDGADCSWLFDDNSKIRYSFSGEMLTVNHETQL